MPLPSVPRDAPGRGQALTLVPGVFLFYFFPPHLGLDLYYDKATQSIALVCQISPLLSGVSVLLAKNTSSLPDGQGILQHWGTIESSCAARISERCN